MNKRYYVIPKGIPRSTEDVVLVIDDPPKLTVICHKDSCYTRPFSDGPNVSDFREVFEEEALKLIIQHGLRTTPEGSMW